MPPPSRVIFPLPEGGSECGFDLTDQEISNCLSESRFAEKQLTESVIEVTWSMCASIANLPGEGESFFGEEYLGRGEMSHKCVNMTVGRICSLARPMGLHAISLISTVKSFALVCFGTWKLPRQSVPQLNRTPLQTQPIAE